MLGTITFLGPEPVLHTVRGPVTRDQVLEAEDDGRVSWAVLAERYGVAPEAIEALMYTATGDTLGPAPAAPVPVPGAPISEALNAHRAHACQSRTLDWTAWLRGLPNPHHVANGGDCQSGVR